MTSVTPQKREMVRLEPSVPVMSGPPLSRPRGILSFSAPDEKPVDLFQLHGIEGIGDRTDRADRTDRTDHAGYARGEEELLRKIKIIHIADMCVHEESIANHERVLADVSKLIKQSKPDLVLITGNLFLPDVQPTAVEIRTASKFIRHVAEMTSITIVDHRGCPIESLPKSVMHRQFPSKFECEGADVKIYAFTGNPDEVKIAQIDAKVDHVGTSFDNTVNIAVFHGMPIIGDQKERAQELHLATTLHLQRYTFCAGSGIPDKLIERNIVFPGTLTQRSIGQNFADKCVAMWDVDVYSRRASATSTLIPIQQRDVSFYLRDEMINQSYLAKLRALSEGQQVKYYSAVYSTNTPVAHAAIVDGIKQLRKQPVSILRAVKPDHSECLDVAYSVQTHYKIMTRAMVSSNVAQDIVEGVIEEHRKRTESGGKIIRTSGGSRVRILSLHFDNMYCYGTKNYINFESLERSISGVLAPNGMGKSSIIDIIMYALYDKYPRAPTKLHVCNSKTDSFYVELRIEVRGVTYSIRKGTAVGCKLAMCTGDTETDLSESTMTATGEKIRNLVGICAHALHVSIFPQTAYQDSFLDMTPVKRRQLITELFSLDCFREIEKDVGSAVKELKRYVDSAEKMRTELERTESLLIEKSSELQERMKQVEERDEVFWNSVSRIARCVTTVAERAEEADREQHEMTGIMARAKEYNDTLEMISQFQDILSKTQPNDESSSAIMEKIKECEIKLDSFTDVEIMQARFRQLDSSIAETKTEISRYSEYSYDTLISHLRNGVRYRDEMLTSASKLEGETIAIAERVRAIRDEEQGLHSAKYNLSVLETYLPMIKPAGILYNEILSPVLATLESRMNEFLLSIGSGMQVFIGLDCGMWFRVGDAGGVPTGGTSDAHAQGDYESDSDYEKVEADGSVDPGSATATQRSMDRGAIPVSLASGYQRFAIDMAFRVSMYSLAEVSIPACIIVDEGFSPCDSDKVYGLVRYIETMACSGIASAPPLTLVITHLTSLRSRLMNILRVYADKETGFSRVLNDYNDCLQAEYSQKKTKTRAAARSTTSAAGTASAIEPRANAFWCDVCKVELSNSYRTRHYASKKHKNNEDKAASRAR